MRSIRSLFSQVYGLIMIFAFILLPGPLVYGGDVTFKGDQTVAGDMNVVSNMMVGETLKVQGTDILEAIGNIQMPIDARPADGVVDMNNHGIINLPAPAVNSDAATKEYVDAVFNGDIGTGTPTGTVPTDGLLMYYSFDADSPTVADDSGNNNIGVVSGATWVNDGGISGGAYSFDGVDDVITVTGGLGDVNDQTVSMWVKKAQAVNTSIAMGLYFVGINDTMNFSVVRFDNSLGEGKIQTFIHTANNDNRYVATEGSVLDTEWHHVVATRHGVELKIYVDSIEDQYLQWAEGMPNGTIRVAGLPVLLGNYAQGAGYHFEGLMDEVRVYNRTLSAEEVQGIYYSSVSGVPLSTVTRGNMDILGDAVVKGKLSAGTVEDVETALNGTAKLDGGNSFTGDQAVNGGLTVAGTLKVGGTDVMVAIGNIPAPIDTRAAAGNVNMAGHRIENLPDPAMDSDAATKAYVDANAGGAPYYYVSDIDVAIGNSAMASGSGVAVGLSASSFSGGTAIGYGAQGGSSGAAVGYNSYGYNNGSALGYSSFAPNYGVAVGNYAMAEGIGNVAIGGGSGMDSAKVSGSMTQDAIQLGRNGDALSESGLFRVWDHVLLDKNTGKIPVERMPEGIGLEYVPQAGDLSMGEFIDGL